MKYFEALKIYNQGKSSYCSPKKGTPEHAKVVAIQKGGGGGSAKPSYADVISMPKPAKKKPSYADVISMPKPAKKKPSYADVISMPKPAKKSAKPAVPSYADILTAPAPRKSYADVLSAPNDNPSYASVISSSMRSNTSGMPLGKSLRGGGAAVISQSIPSEISIPTNFPVISAVAPAAPAGVLGKEAGKMINMALKGRLARKKMKEAEKQMLFDIFLK